MKRLRMLVTAVFVGLMIAACMVTAVAGSGLAANGVTWTTAHHGGNGAEYKYQTFSIDVLTLTGSYGDQFGDQYNGQTYTYCINHGAKYLASLYGADKQYLVHNEANAVYWQNNFGQNKTVINGIKITLRYGFPQRTPYDLGVSTVDDAYAATQVIIWEYQAGYRTNGTSLNNATLYNGYIAGTPAETAYNNILSAIRADDFMAIPSFGYRFTTIAQNAGATQLIFNSSTSRYEASFTDTTGNLAKYGTMPYTCSNSQITCVISGNTMTISSATAITSDSVLTFTRIFAPKGGQELRFLDYSDSSNGIAQQMILGVEGSPSWFYLRIGATSSCNLRLHKADSVSGQYLTGASFSVYEYTSSTGSYTNRGNLTYTPDFGGTYAFDGLRYTTDNGGRFYVRENAAPTGYTISSTNTYFTISPSDTLATISGKELGQGGYPILTNVAKDVNFQWYKVDSSTKVTLKLASGSEAQFKVIGWSNASKMYDTYPDATITYTASTGLYQLKGLKCTADNPYGAYYLVETMPPDGYTYNEYDDGRLANTDRVVYNLTLKSGETWRFTGFQSTCNWIGDVTATGIGNDKNTLTLAFNSYDPLQVDTDGSTRLEYWTVPGTEFTIQVSSSSSAGGTYTTDSSLQLVNVNGECVVTGVLPNKWYKITQTVTPTGYYASTDEMTREIYIEQGTDAAGHATYKVYSSKGVVYAKAETGRYIYLSENNPQSPTAPLGVTTQSDIMKIAKNASTAEYCNGMLFENRQRPSYYSYEKVSSEDPNQTVTGAGFKVEELYSSAGKEPSWETTDSTTRKATTVYKPWYATSGTGYDMPYFPKSKFTGATWYSRDTEDNSLFYLDLTGTSGFTFTQFTLPTSTTGNIVLHYAMDLPTSSTRTFTYAVNDGAAQTITLPGTGGLNTFGTYTISGVVLSTSANNTIVFNTTALGSNTCRIADIQTVYSKTPKITDTYSYEKATLSNASVVNNSVQLQQSSSSTASFVIMGYGQKTTGYITYTATASSYLTVSCNGTSTRIYLAASTVQKTVTVSLPPFTGTGTVKIYWYSGGVVSLYGLTTSSPYYVVNPSVVNGSTWTIGPVYQTAYNGNVYKLVETTIPDGYDTNGLEFLDEHYVAPQYEEYFSDTEYFFYSPAAGSGTVQYPTNTPDITNVPDPITVTFTKRDSLTETGITTAGFAVYEYSAIAGHYVPSTRAAITQSGAVYTVSNLYATIDNCGLYYICETSVPQGYELISDGANPEGWTLIDLNGKTPGQTYDIGSIYNKPIPVTVYWYKKDMNTNQNLAGAQFKVYRSTSTGYDVMNCDIRYDITSKSYVTELPAGYYLISETVAPEGYYLTSYVISPSLSQSQAGNIVNAGSLYNEKMPVTVTWYKVDEDTSIALPGATFKVQEYMAVTNSYTDTSIAVTYDSSTKLYRAENLKVTSGNCGYFRIVETAAPKYHTISTPNTTISIIDCIGGTVNRIEAVTNPCWQGDIGITARSLGSSVYTDSTFMVSADITNTSGYDFDPSNPLKVTMSGYYYTNDNVLKRLPTQTQTVVCPRYGQFVWATISLDGSSVRDNHIFIKWVVAPAYPQNFKDTDTTNDTSRITVRTKDYVASVTPDKDLQLDRPASFYRTDNPPTSGLLQTPPSWSYYIYGSNGFEKITKSASVQLYPSLTIDPSAVWKETRSGVLYTRSGYGLNANLYYGGSNYTGKGRAYAYAPEFNYSHANGEYISMIGQGAFSFPVNPSSINDSKVHFTPVWFPDGKYTIQYAIDDLWCPTGEIKAATTSYIMIEGSMYDDWYTSRG